MKTSSIQGDSFDTLCSNLISLLASNPIKPSLALVFCGPGHDIQALQSLFQSYDIELCGATTAGEIAENQVWEDTIVCLLLELPRDSFYVPEIGDSTSSIFQRAQKVGEDALERFSNPLVLVVASGLDTDGEAVINGLKSKLGSDATIFGGLAGDNFQMEATFVFNQQAKSSKGVCGIVFDGDKIRMEGLASSGWRPVGIEKVITHAEGNIVYTIDDEPALKVYQHYFGFSSELDPQKDIVNTLGVQFPLLLERDYGKAVIRWPIMANPENDSLIFAGSLPQGAKVKFSIPPNFDIVQKIIEENKIFQQQFPDPDAMILFSCKARHVALGPMIQEEVEGLGKLWEAPMVGYFTYGEIGSLKDSPSDFHNETCSLVLLKEIS